MNLSKFMQATPNVMVFRHAPTAISTWYLRTLGRMYYIANRAERSLIEKNILRVFSDSKETGAIIRRTFDGIFRHYAEKLIMAHRDYSVVKRELRHSLHYSGLGYLDTALMRGGVVMVTGHFGAVEFMPLALALRGYPVTMVVKFQTEALRKSLMHRAAEVDVELVDCSDGNVINHALDALRRGRILLTECDEVDAWKRTGTSTIDAFGRRIWLDRSIEVLCRRTKASVLGGFMIRRPAGYRMAVVPFGDQDRLKREGISAVAIKTFEKYVMRFPDQWYQWKKFHMMLAEEA